MKVFLLYDAANNALKSTADKLKGLLNNKNAKVFDKSSASYKNELFESRYLIILADSLKSFTYADADWRYFVNEMKWKRKKEGDIIILADESVDPARIPLALRGKSFYQLNETDFIESLDYVDNSQPASEAAFEPIALQVTDDETLMAHVQAIKAKQRQASLDIDSTKSEPQQRQNGCPDAHIFEAEDKRNAAEDSLKARLEQKRREVSDRYEQRQQSQMGHKPKDRYVDEPRADNYSDNKDPFPGYGSKNKHNLPTNSKIGCGIGAFFVVFIFIVIVTILSNL